MEIAFFVSGGGGNLAAVLALQDASPGLLRIGLVVADRPGIKALEMANERGIPTIVKDFDAECGRTRDFRSDAAALARYQKQSEHLHDQILTEIIEYERSTARPIDLAVLSYRRIIRGKLLRYFSGRMINQHPGDLSVKRSDGRRKYIGISAVFDALSSGERRTRTSTILVNDGIDEGEIFARGPWIDFNGTDITERSAHEHELSQKQVSDWPLIKFVVGEIARRAFELEVTSEGERRIFYRKIYVGTCGLDLCDVAQARQMRSDL